MIVRIRHGARPNQQRLLKLRSLVARPLRALSIALALLCASACHEPAASNSVSCQDGAAPVDTKLLAYLSRARNAHHLADAHVDAEQLELAVKALRELLTGPTPGTNDLAPEIREVQADTHARLADLESQLGHFDAAAAEVTAGLALVPETNYYRGHLFEMSGLTDERRAQQLARDGRNEESRAAQQRAITAFEKAMQLQAEVIEKALGEAPSSAASSDAATNGATAPRR